MLLALSGSVCTVALAQNPFAASPGDTPPPADAAPAANPFGAPASESAAAPLNPFGSPDTPPVSAANPFEPQFGGPGTEAAAPATDAPPDNAPVNPFGVAAQPAPASTESTSPFQFGAPTTGTDTESGSRRVSQLFEFRYAVKLGRDGRQIVSRQRLTREEAEVFDADLKSYYVDMVNAGEAPNYSGGNPDEWAQWLAYANQLQLWSTYVRDVVLVGTGVEFDPASDIPWPYDVQLAKQDAADRESGNQRGGSEDFGGGKESGGGGRPQAPRDIRNENRSLDDQLADFSIVPDTRPGSSTANAPVIDPSQMDDAAIALYQRFNSTLRSFEQQQVAYMKIFKNDLDKRREKREAYSEWREDQKEQIIEYLDEWSRRYEGQVLTIAGVRYELYRPGSEPKQHRDAVTVITDYDITPYDLLDENGVLRTEIDN